MNVSCLIASAATSIGFGPALYKKRPKGSATTYQVAIIPFLAYVQIAGMIARRIVCDLSEGDAVRQGQRVGMIRFGSRVDVFLPADAELRVAKGDRVRAGESVIGVLP